MTSRRSALVISVLLCLALVAAAREVPSAGELRQMVTDKQYKRALREVARAMQLKGDDAVGYDKAQLLLIRADAQLGMRVEPSAAKSFRDAADAATDDDTRATGRAMALLMSRCERLIYRPRTAAQGGGGGAGREVDIVTDRQAALDALLADELAALEPRVRTAKEKRSIPEALEAVSAIEPVAAVERAATASTRRTDELRAGFVGHVEALLDDTLIALDRKADDVESTARGLIVVPPDARTAPPKPGMAHVKRRGLSPADEAALKSVMESCREIVSRSRDVAEALGAEPDRYRRASDFAIRLSSKAGAIMRADYSGVTEQPVGAVAPPTERTETSPPPPAPAE